MASIETKIKTNDDEVTIVAYKHMDWRGFRHQWWTKSSEIVHTEGNTYTDETTLARHISLIKSVYGALTTRSLSLDKFLALNVKREEEVSDE